MSISILHSSVILSGETLLLCDTHVLQQAELRAASQETDKSMEVIESATTVNTGTAGRIREL